MKEGAALVEWEEGEAVTRLDPEASGLDRLRTADAVGGSHVLDLVRRDAAEVEIAVDRALVAVVRAQPHVQLDTRNMAGPRPVVVRVPDDVRLVVRIVKRPGVGAGRREL